MKVVLAKESDSGRWQEFIATQPSSTNYHRWQWRHVVQRAFGWSSFYFLAEDERRICGILPLVWLKSRLFGNLLCSVPFFSYAGIVAEKEESQAELLAAAIDLARKLKVSYLELRHRQRLPLNLRSKTSKNTLVCDLSADPEEMLRRLTTKMRTNVRRAMKTGLRAEFGGTEFLDDFYDVFALKMRELGTPVYAKAFFAEILRAFPAESHVCRIRHEERTVAAAFLTGYRESVEANWSASAPQFLHLRPNMFMFWSLLCFAGQMGYRIFDFGRSTVGSGTYEFKLQWNAHPESLFWDYWTPAGDPALELNPENPRYKLAIWAWRRMPLFLTKLLGPPIARCLP